MKGKFRILGHVGLALFVAAALTLAAMPAQVEATPGVTAVWVEFPDAGDNAASNTDAEYKIHFTTGSALTRGVDTITVWFPDGTTAMGPAAFASVSGASTTAGNYEVKGTGITYYACTSAATAAGYRLKVTTPVDIPATTAAVLWIKPGANIDTPGTAGNTYKVKVATSQDTTFVPCSNANRFSVDNTAVSGVDNVTTMPTSSVAGTASAYGFKFTTSTAVTTLGWIKVQFPVGTYLPESIEDLTNVKAGDAGQK